jgi:hypothetical protein
VCWLSWATVVLSVLFFLNCVGRVIGDGDVLSICSRAQQAKERSPQHTAHNPQPPPQPQRLAYLLAHHVAAVLAVSQLRVGGRVLTCTHALRLSPSTGAKAKEKKLCHFVWACAHPLASVTAHRVLCRQDVAHRG